MANTAQAVEELKRTIAEEQEALAKARLAAQLCERADDGTSLCVCALMDAHKRKKRGRVIRIRSFVWRWTWQGQREQCHWRTPPLVYAFFCSCTAPFEICVLALPTCPPSLTYPPSLYCALLVLFISLVFSRPKRVYINRRMLT
eukprot:6177460-Pleurochrysis_carterae.AAC.1